MKQVMIQDLDSVSGGFDGFGNGYQPNPQAFAPLPAAVPFIGRLAVAGGAGLGAFNAGAYAIEGVVGHIDNLNAIGARIGEGAFNAMHPNPLGQMVFTLDDFKK